jgi:type II secretory pathway component GspD/PulD (secretin)
VIGFLFGRTTKSETKQDLLILVTPHLLDEGERVGAGSPGSR